MRGIAAALALAVALPLAGCGKVGPPRQPGPRDAITYPRPYPAPDRPIQQPQQPTAAQQATPGQPAAAQATAPPPSAAPAR